MTEEETEQQKITKKADERRKCRRHPAIELNAEIKVKKGLFGEWVSVKACDYNKRGMSIETGLALQPEQAITLKVILKMDTGDIKVEKIEGFIKNCIKAKPHPRYGVEFNYSANRHMKSLDTKSQLGRIEGIMERSESLRQKIDEQQNMDQI